MKPNQVDDREGLKVDPEIDLDDILNAENNTMGSDYDDEEDGDRDDDGISDIDEDLLDDEDEEADDLDDDLDEDE